MLLTCCGNHLFMPLRAQVLGAWASASSCGVMAPGATTSAPLS
jgi:hypothetical protein